MRHISLPSLALALLLAAPPALPASKGEVIKVDRWTYKVIHHDIQIMVGVRLLSIKHRPYKYLPLQLSITNYGKTSARVDLKNFRLTDSDGDSYPLAELSEVRAEHRLLQYDKERSRILGFPELDQTPARLVPTRFYPVQGEPVDPNIEILEGERIVDLIYFRDEKQRSPKKLLLTIEGLIDAPAVSIPLEIPGA